MSTSPSGRRLLTILGAVAVVGTAAVALGLRPWDHDDHGCLDRLRRHLPEDPVVLQGADLERARQAGYDDRDVDALVDSTFETGITPDPISSRSILAQREADSGAGYAPGAVDCWAGDLGTFAARGDFDADAVRDGTSGDDTEVRDDLLVSGSSDARDAIRRGTDLPPAADAALTAVEDEDVVSFYLTATIDDGGAWAGVGLAPGDEWDLVVVWSFPDDDRAREGEAAIRAALESGSTIAEMVDDAADALRRTGSVVALRAPMTVEATRWGHPVRVLDPALLVGRGD